MEINVKNSPEHHMRSKWTQGSEFVESRVGDESSLKAM